MHKIKSISNIAIITALIFILSISFEYIIPVGYFGSYVKPNPFEGILFVTVFLLSLQKSLAIIFLYSFLILFFKGFSYLIFIEVIALLAAMLTMAISFYFFLKKWKLKTSIVLTVLTITIVMTFLNALIITPTYMNLDKQALSFYWDVFPEKNFFDMIIFVSNFFPLGGGILHGNLVKYGFSGIVGYFGIKSLSKMSAYKK